MYFKHNAINFYLLLVSFIIFVLASNAYSDSASACQELEASFEKVGKLQYYFPDSSSFQKCWFLQVNQSVFFTTKLTYINISNSYYNDVDSSCEDSPIYLVIQPAYDESGESSPRRYCGQQRDTVPATFHTSKLKIALERSYALNEYYNDYHGVADSPHPAFDYHGVVGFILEYNIRSGHLSKYVAISSYTFITSPGFPVLSREFTSMTWKVTGLPVDYDSSRSLELIINTWNVYPDGYQDPSLLVYDGSNSKSPLLLQMFSSEQPRFNTAKSTGLLMFIKFNNHIPTYAYHLVYHGFNITVKQADFCLPGTRLADVIEIGQLDCVPFFDVVVYSFIVITPPSSLYAPPVWKVTSASSIVLQFTFVVWNRLSHDNSVLSVFDGPDGDFPLIGSYGHNALYQTPHRISSTGSSLYIRCTDIILNIGVGFNGTVKIKGYCLPGTSTCGDGVNCFSEYQHCDGNMDCPNNADERGCGGCPSNEFWCGGEQRKCYTEVERCNGKHDCSPPNRDETNCLSCSPGSFHCKRSLTCIYEEWRCDGQKDCPDNEDEENCTYTLSRRVTTAVILGSLICGLLMAIALGCSCKLYALRTASRRRNRVYRMANATPFNRVTRELLMREAPPSYSMTVDGVEINDESSRRRRRQRRRRRRRPNRDLPAIRRAQPLPTPGSQATSQEARTASSSVSSDRAQGGGASSSGGSTDPAPSMPSQLDVSEATAFTLAEIGLVNYPSDVTSGPRSSAPSVSNSSAAQSSSSAPYETQTSTEPPTSSSAASPTDIELQAAPLPKKSIPPVMVEAPFTPVIVGDVPACVYPNPPTYHEAVDSGDPPTPTNIVVINDESPGDEPKAAFSPRIILSKLKHSPGKLRDYIKSSSFQSIFNTGAIPGDLTAHGSCIDDDQVQLINDFSSEDSSPLAFDNEISMSGNSDEADPVPHPASAGEGSVAIELKSYAAPSCSRESAIVLIGRDSSRDDLVGQSASSTFPEPFVDAGENLSKVQRTDERGSDAERLEVV